MLPAGQRSELPHLDLFASNSPLDAKLMASCSDHDVPAMPAKIDRLRARTWSRVQSGS